MEFSGTKVALIFGNKLIMQLRDNKPDLRYLKAYFLVGQVTKDDVDNIKFGDEGQRWDFMDFDTFFTSEDVVPHLKGRFQDYLDTL